MTGSMTSISMPSTLTVAEAVDVDVGRVGDLVGGDRLGLGEDRLGDVLGGRAAGADIVFDAEIAVAARRDCGSPTG